MSNKPPRVDRRIRRAEGTYVSPWIMPGRTVHRSRMAAFIAKYTPRMRGLFYQDRGVSPKPGWKFVMLDSGNGHMTIARVRA